MTKPPTVSRRGLLVAGASVVVGGGVAARALRAPPGPPTGAAPGQPAPVGLELWASAFGAVGDGVADDGPALRRALHAAAAAGAGTTLRVGEGRYRVGGSPEARYALPVSGAAGLSIVGEQATVVVTDPTLGCLSFSDSSGCRVEGVTIDYDPPPFTQTVVTALDPPSRTFDVEVAPGYPLLDSSFFPFPAPDDPHLGTFGAVFDPATRLLKAGLVDYVAVAGAERLDPRAFRLRTLDDLPVGLSAGDVFVYLARSSGHAVACYRSPDMTVRNVHVRAANAVAFAVVQSDAVRITGSSVEVEPGSNRLVSSNADGVHAQGCRVGPTVEDCSFAGMMDDGINVYALPLTVLRVPSDVEIVVAGDESVRTGDRLEFTEPVSGQITGVRRIASVTPSGPALLVRLETPLSGLTYSLQEGVAYVAFNLSASGEDYLIRANRYERHRGHAMRLHTGRGSVENNSISHTSREGIVVSNDPDWPEGPHTRRLRIRGNTLTSTGGGAGIDVEGRKLGYQIADTATQRRIRIEDNTVTNWRGSAILVGAAHDVKLFDNVLSLDAEAEPHAAEQGVLLERAFDVEIDGLVIKTALPGALTVGIEIGATVTPGEAGVRIRDVRAPTVLATVQDSRVTPPVTTPVSSSAAWKAVSASTVSRGGRSRRTDALELGCRVGVSR